MLIAIIVTGVALLAFLRTTSIRESLESRGVNTNKFLHLDRMQGVYFVIAMVGLFVITGLIEGSSSL